MLAALRNRQQQQRAMSNQLRNRKGADNQPQQQRAGRTPAVAAEEASAARTCDSFFFFLCAAVFSLAVLVHWHIVFHAHDWVYDDGSVIEDNPMLKGDPVRGPVEPLSQLLYTDYWGTPMTDDIMSHLSFRPFTSLTFRLQVRAPAGNLQTLVLAGVQGGRH